MSAREFRVLAHTQPINQRKKNRISNSSNLHPNKKNKHINMSDTTTNNASVNVNKDVKKVNDEVRRVFPFFFFVNSFFRVRASKTSTYFFVLNVLFVTEDGNNRCYKEQE